MDEFVLFWTHDIMLVWGRTALNAASNSAALKTSTFLHDYDNLRVCIQDRPNTNNTSLSLLYKAGLPLLIMDVSGIPRRIVCTLQQTEQRVIWAMNLPYFYHGFTTVDSDRGVSSLRRLTSSTDDAKLMALEKSTRVDDPNWCCSCLVRYTESLLVTIHGTHYQCNECHFYQVSDCFHRQHNREKIEIELE